MATDPRSMRAAEPPSASAMALLDPCGDGDAAMVEEAEVEIVGLAQPLAAARPMPARRNPLESKPRIDEEPGFSLQSHLDEASVEIVIVDKPTRGRESET